MTSSIFVLAQAIPLPISATQAAPRLPLVPLAKTEAERPLKTSHAIAPPAQAQRGSIEQLVDVLEARGRFGGADGAFKSLADLLKGPADGSSAVPDMSSQVSKAGRVTGGVKPKAIDSESSLLQAASSEGERPA